MSTLELISFEIGGQAFCIDIGTVREIRGWTVATPIPHSPDYILGVINLRGTVMPVLDLRARLGLGKAETSSRSVIVVVQNGPKLAGLLVDAVQETFQIEADRLQAPPNLDYTSNEVVVDAIIPLETGMLSRLVVSALLPAEEAAAA